ncbi:restriction endonuclease subunit S [Metamycoplasma equirhinis]|uniref:restriction endonuclease subunit S n=1 Tax=Metamycoplasma equirhinis TaxID=92402 RepID=UPI003593D07D
MEFKCLWELVDFDKRFNGVEKYKQTNILKFNNLSAKKLQEYTVNNKEGSVRLLSTGKYDGFITYNKNDKNINFGEVISIPTGGTVTLKYHNGYFVNSLNILMSSKSKNNLNLKYLFYFLLNNINLIEDNFRGSSIKHPNMKEILNFKIPVPPIKIQNEIVNILDKFTGLTAELTAGLTAELTARQKQYEYYRNTLLNFNDIKLGGQ